MLVRVVLAVKEAPARRRMQRLLEGHDIQVHAVSGKNLVWEEFSRISCDLVVLHESLLPQNPAQALAEVVSLPYPVGIAILADFDNLARATELRAAGATAVLYYGEDDQVLDSGLDTVIKERRMLLEKTVAARRLGARPRLSDFVSDSPAMQHFLKLARQVSNSEVPLFVLGETGVGKERLARAIHEDSSRCGGPFIALNCGAIPENLMESELFGHEEGAFTGATRTRRGCFELAHRGTLFMDEICEMPVHLQVKLLRVLQDFTFAPVGGEYSVSVDVRVIAATNKNILEEVQAKRFRQDLYYRLSVIKLELPPLRERHEDIPTLVESFTKEIGMRIGKQVKGVDDQAMDALLKYRWPGNIRELINVLERGILLCERPSLGLFDLPEELRHPGSYLDSVSVLDIPEDWLNRSLKEVRQQIVEQCERAYLVRLLTETRGRINETAERAGIETRSLSGKMKRYGLRKEDYKHAKV